MLAERHLENVLDRVSPDKRTIVRVLETNTLAQAVGRLWREESLFPIASVSISIFDDDGTIGDPWRKTYGKGYKGKSLEIVRYFCKSQLWQPIVVSNNPYRNKPIRDAVGAENIFVPCVPSFYKQSEKSVHDVLERLAAIGAESSIFSLYMVGDREGDLDFFSKLVGNYRNLNTNGNVKAMFIKLPERRILRSRVGVLIP